MLSSTLVRQVGKQEHPQNRRGRGLGPVRYYHVMRPRTVSSQNMPYQLKADDPGNDQADAGEPDRMGGLEEKRHAEERRPDRADAGPNGVSGPPRGKCAMPTRGATG